MSDLRPSRRHQVDLEVVLDDLDELSEYLAYQQEFEDEEDVEDTLPHQGVLPLPLGNQEHIPILEPARPRESLEEPPVEGAVGGGPPLS